MVKEGTVGFVGVGDTAFMGGVLAGKGAPSDT